MTCKLDAGRIVGGERVVARIAAFHQALQGLGWNVGRNIRVEIRWAAGEPDRIRKFADE